MKLDIRYQKLAPSDECDRYVRSRFGAALDRLEAKIGPVAVRLGQNGRAEIICRVTAKLRTGPRLVVESRSAELRDAIDRAAQKLAHTTESALGKRVAHRTNA